MTKFEYCFLESNLSTKNGLKFKLIEPSGNVVIPNGKTLSGCLNELGEIGWELVTLLDERFTSHGHDTTFILKRQIL
jgi:hypothetical protein